VIDEWRECVCVGVYKRFKEGANEEKQEGDDVKFFWFLYNDSLIWRVSFLSQPLNEIVIKTFKHHLIQDTLYLMFLFFD
jgi:hypothetical protein